MKLHINYIIQNFFPYSFVPKFIRQYCSIGWLKQVNHTLSAFREYILEIIKNKRNDIKSRKNMSRDILTLLIEGSAINNEHAPLSTNELYSNTVIFISAGHET